MFDRRSHREKWIHDKTRYQVKKNVREKTIPGLFYLTDVFQLVINRFNYKSFSLLYYIIS